MTVYNLTVVEADAGWVIKCQVPGEIHCQSDTIDI